jgi:hypothetical protein
VWMPNKPAKFSTFNFNKGDLERRRTKRERELHSTSLRELHSTSLRELHSTSLRELHSTSLRAPQTYYIPLSPSPSPLPRPSPSLSSSSSSSSAPARPPLPRHLPRIYHL